MSNHLRFGRFVRTPKGVMLLILVVLGIVASAASGVSRVLPVLAGAVVTAMVIDVIVLRLRKRRWVFPDGAFLTGLFVAMIMAPEEPWYVAAVTAAIAVLGKYVLRVGKANIFNPAAFGVVATFYIFDPAQNWWGAVPDLPVVSLVLLLASGVFITLRLNKAPVVLSFLGTYFLLASVAAFVSDPSSVAELYRTPDLQAALFFAFFMVSDPPTSPPKHRDQVLFGAIVAVASVVIFETIGAAYFILAGLLIGNIHEAWRRSRNNQRRMA